MTGSQVHLRLEKIILPKAQLKAGSVRSHHLESCVGKPWKVLFRSLSGKLLYSWLVPARTDGWHYSSPAAISECHEVCFNTFLQHVQVPLGSSPALQCDKHFFPKLVLLVVFSPSHCMVMSTVQEDIVTYKSKSKLSTE